MKEIKNKIRVAVLYGGKSGEHEVSLISARSVIQYLDKERFEVVPIAIDKQGRWYLNKLIDIYLPDHKRLLLGENLGEHLPLPIGELASTHNSPQVVGNLSFDVVFPVMHGPLCEDGAIQGLLEIANVPFVGSGVLASAIGMDKDISKLLAKTAGIVCPEHLILHARADQSARAMFCQEVEKKLGLPVFVKPARLGSSVGIEKAKTLEQVAHCIEQAFRFDDKVIVEQAIDGIDIELSVLENKEYGLPPLVSVPGQIGVAENHDFYSYEAKYLDPEGADLIVPAELSAAQTEEAKKMAISLFQALECEGMARVDLFLERTTGRLLFNEINTIPGFTHISMYPRLWEASGLHYTDLLSHLIDVAIMRFDRKQKLIRDFHAV